MTTRKPSKPTPGSAASDHVRVSFLAASRHVGRQIQVDGQWWTVDQRYGYGPHPFVSVWVRERDEPLQLHPDTEVPVRDPKPSPHTVIVAGTSPMAVLLGTVPVHVRELLFEPVRAVVVDATTPERALDRAYGDHLVPLPTAPVPLAKGTTWTVIAEVDAYDKHPLALAAVAGDVQVYGHYDRMSRIRSVQVVEAGTPEAAIEQVASRWYRYYDDED